MKSIARMVRRAKHSGFNVRVALIAVAVVVLIGYLIFRSFAAGTSSSVEPENANLTNATAVTDSAASGGRALKFGSGTTGGGGGPLTSSNFALGVTYFSGNPSFAGASDSNLAQVVDAANQHLLNFGGAVGDGCSQNNGGIVGDTNWAHYDWSSVDGRINHMKNENIKMKTITLQAAPVWMTGTGACDWNNLSIRKVLPQYINQWADYCHYVVAKYLPQGVKYYQVWNELKGYYNSSGGWDFGDANSGYIQMYNAVWDRIKSDPATAGAQIGGPYAIMTQHQNGWGGGEEIKGDWGSIDPVVSNGYKTFFAQAHGYDFVAVDYSQGDVAGEHGGSYNPNGYSAERQMHYFHDINVWLRSKSNKPIVAAEAYGSTNTSDIANLLDQFRTGGGNAFFLWHQQPGIAGLLVDGNGNPTDLWSAFRAYKQAHPFP